jgi:hypothetical protein
MESIIPLISEVGFAIAVTLYLLYHMAFFVKFVVKIQRPILT